MATAAASGQADQVAEALACAVAAVSGDGTEGATTGHACEAIARPALARVLTRELRRLLADEPELAGMARQARQEAEQNGAWSSLRKELARTLARDQERLAEVWALLEAAGATNGARRPGPAAPAPPRALATILDRLEKAGAMLVITATVLLPLAAAGVYPGRAASLLRWFAVVVLSALPGWLFLRFIVYRAGSLWTDYVLHLHRLGVDAHPNLPEPPRSSGYYRLWYDGGGPAVAAADNIYQQKFEAYYGKAAGPAATGSQLLRDRGVFTVLLSTAVFAVGWTVVLHDRTPLALDAAHPAASALRFGFLGAYSFSLQMLMRRFFQSDLKASAYTAAVVRVISVLILVLVLVRSDVLGGDLRVIGPTAFVIGFFPLVGMQLLQKAFTAALRRWLPTLRNPYPLSDLDGLNVWYEARLLEEGIEDMQNLITANFVDVLLHTRVPVGRLVDWVDQAHLFLLLDPSEDDGAKPREHPDRLTLRRMGIRTATDLESAVTAPARLAARANSCAVSRLSERDGAYTNSVLGLLDRPASGGASAVDGLLKTFCNMPNLVPVRHWRDVLNVDHC